MGEGKHPASVFSPKKEVHQLLVRTKGRDLPEWRRFSRVIHWESRAGKPAGKHSKAVGKPNASVRTVIRNVLVTSMAMDGPSDTAQCRCGGGCSSRRVQRRGDREGGRELYTPTAVVEHEL